MYDPADEPLPDADVFRPETRVTLAQVLASAEAALDGTALRDTRSAFAALARAGVDLTPGSPPRPRCGPSSTASPRPGSA